MFSWLNLNIKTTQKFFVVTTWGCPGPASSACTPLTRRTGCWSWPGRWRRTQRAQRGRYGSSVAPWTSWNAPVLLCPRAGAGFEKQEERVTRREGGSGHGWSAKKEETNGEDRKRNGVLKHPSKQEASDTHGHAATHHQDERKQRNKHVDVVLRRSEFCCMNPVPKCQLKATADPMMDK